MIRRGKRDEKGYEPLAFRVKIDYPQNGT